LLENGNGDPQFSLDLVTAFLVVESISKKVLSLGEKDRNEDRKDRNEDRTILTADHVNVYNAIKLNPTIKYDQLMDNLGLSKSKIYHIITILKETRYIERQGGTKRPKWEILKELKV
jgi:predicted HTH transcriptional regulator